MRRWAITTWEQPPQPTSQIYPKTKLSETVSKRRLSKRNPTARSVRFTKMYARQIQVAVRLYMDILAKFKKAKFITFQPSTNFTIKPVNQQLNIILK
jgi:hypothetical protein